MIHVSTHIEPEYRQEFGGRLGFGFGVRAGQKIRLSLGVDYWIRHGVSVVEFSMLTALSNGRVRGYRLGRDV